jgi:hypothetical protein
MNETIYARSFNLADKETVVNSIAVYVSPVNTGDINSVYHWIVSLNTGTPTSVTLDMIPGADSRTGVLMITSHKTKPLLVISASFTFQVLRANAVTVGEVLDVLRAQGFDRYRYDDSGSGCRYWCTMVVKELESSKILPAGSKDTFLQYVGEQNAVKPLSMPMPLREGTFYS